RRCPQEFFQSYSEGVSEKRNHIRPELISAIRSSKIAIILLSRNYASSKWCLDELVEIMKCKEELDQTALPIFYDVEPSQVKKLTGDFGKVFRKTCASRSNEETERWRQALVDVATTAGYHSINCL
uniref:TIR domain-containing protein n=1 Tax=Brassica oleracea var. oleracea TaxID=109376 RepID=A0A0D3DAL7_BRAOL